MARRFSPVAAGTLVAVLSGVMVLLVAGPASAGDRTVTFAGSSLIGALACSSDPDQSSVSITSADTLTVVNMTGQTATVYVNGKSTSHSLNTDQSVPITFPAFDEGTTQDISLVPSCLLLNLSQAGSVGVAVTTPAQVPDPAPAPTPTRTTAPTTAPGGGTSTISKPSRTPKSPKPSKAGASSEPATVAPTGTGPTPETSVSGGPRSATASSSAATLPGTSTGSPNSSHPPARKTSKGPATITGSGPESVNIGAAQALSAADIEPAAPDYLLAVIALILVLGVGSASVRAVLTQRRLRRAAW